MLVSPDLTADLKMLVSPDLKSPVNGALTANDNGVRQTANGKRRGDFLLLSARFAGRGVGNRRR